MPLGTIPYLRVAKVAASYTATTSCQAQIGKTTIGATALSGGGLQTFVSKFTATGAGTITSISVYFASPLPPTMAVVLYSDSAGSPATLLRSATAVIAAGWNTVAVTGYVVAANEVLWIGTSINDEDFGLSYDTGALNQFADRAAYLPNPFGTAIFTARELSAYATCTP